MSGYNNFMLQQKSETKTQQKTKIENYDQIIVYKKIWVRRGQVYDNVRNSIYILFKTRL